MNSSNCSVDILIAMQNYDIYKKPLIACIFFNVLLSMSATLGNGLVIIVILKSQNLQSPSYLLITSLAFTDLLVGLVYHPYLTLAAVFLLKVNSNTLCKGSLLLNAGAHIINIVLCVMLVMNLLISIDRYLALTLKHRYRIHVTKKRVRFAIVVGWLGTAFIYLALTAIAKIADEVSFLLFSPFLVTLAATAVFYIMIFITLHRYTFQVHAQQPYALPGNFEVEKYRKTAKTMAAILGCFVFFYSVLLTPSIVSLVTGKVTLVLITACSTIFAALSSINPNIYLTRFRDIRRGCKQLLKIN